MTARNVGPDGEPALSGLDFRALDAALERLDRPMPLWWRDDDAATATPALDRLLARAERFGAPITLAAIPTALTSSLPKRLEAAPADVSVAVHGWAHANHAPAGVKKAEFGAHRPLETLAEEATAGRARLADAFGPRLTPAFVPPWNRVDPALAPMLAHAGYRALSTFNLRAAPAAAPGVAAVNTHIDPIDWRGRRSLADPQRLIDRLADLASFAANTGVMEPIGLLTHHLDEDDAVIAFQITLLSHLNDKTTVVWLTLPEAIDDALQIGATSSKGSNGG